MSEAQPIYRERPDWHMRVEDSFIPVGNIPVPVGYRMLVRPIKIAEKTSGGIHLVDETVKVKEHLRFVAQVLALGPECYKHPKFMEGEPWCRVGDWILLRQYAGQGFEVLDERGDAVIVKLVNDDEVLATSKRPESLVV